MVNAVAAERHRVAEVLVRSGERRTSRTLSNSSDDDEKERSCFYEGTDDRGTTRGSFLRKKKREAVINDCIWGFPRCPLLPPCSCHPCSKAKSILFLLSDLSDFILKKERSYCQAALGAFRVFSAVYAFGVATFTPKSLKHTEMQRQTPRRETLPPLNLVWTFWAVFSYK